LNYRPWLRGLGRFSGDEEIEVCAATASDEEEIRALAARALWTGRFHADPMVGPEIGNRRYVQWATSAFRHPGQQVLKCLVRDRIAAFMVVERPSDSSRFWSLVGVAPEVTGKGVGRRICGSVLATDHHEGVQEVKTSISSHNAIVHNLYVSLRFRFPLPDITRSQFLRGQVDKYTWMDVGSSYAPSDMLAAYLLGQLENMERITRRRRAIYERYAAAPAPLADNHIGVPFAPQHCATNHHMFYILTADLEERTALIAHLREAGILAVFHYVPLHSSPSARSIGIPQARLPVTFRVSSRLIRLPMYYDLADHGSIKSHIASRHSTLACEWASNRPAGERSLAGPGRE
jgi:hypothetical protein